MTNKCGTCREAKKRCEDRIEASAGDNRCRRCYELGHQCGPRERPRRASITSPPSHGQSPRTNILVTKREVNEDRSYSMNNDNNKSPSLERSVDWLVVLIGLLEILIYLGQISSRIQHAGGKMAIDKIEPSLKGFTEWCQRLTESNIYDPALEDPDPASLHQRMLTGLRSLYNTQRMWLEGGIQPDHFFTSKDPNFWVMNDRDHGPGFGPLAMTSHVPRSITLRWKTNCPRLDKTAKPEERAIGYQEFANWIAQLLMLYRKDPSLKTMDVNLLSKVPSDSVDITFPASHIALLNGDSEVLDQMLRCNPDALGDYDFLGRCLPVLVIERRNQDLFDRLADDHDDFLEQVKPDKFGLKLQHHACISGNASALCRLAGDKIGKANMQEMIVMGIVSDSRPVLKALFKASPVVKNLWTLIQRSIRLGSDKAAEFLVTQIGTESPSIGERTRKLADLADRNGMLDLARQLRSMRQKTTTPQEMLESLHSLMTIV